MQKLNAFFDLDGPILDVSHRHYLVYSNIVKSFGVSPVGQTDFWSAKRQKVTDELILSRSGVAHLINEYTERKLKLIEMDEYLEFDQLQEGSIETLARIKKRFYLVLVTLRRSRTALEQQLKRMGIDRYFDQILSSGDTEGEGWKTKFNLITNCDLILGPNDFFAGDTETDIIAGKNLGTKTIAVMNGIRENDYLIHLNPTFTVASIREIVSLSI